MYEIAMSRLLAKSDEDSMAKRKFVNTLKKKLIRNEQFHMTYKKQPSETSS